jgi:K+ transporter
MKKAKHNNLLTKMNQKADEKIIMQISSTDPAINIDQSFEVDPHAITRKREHEKKLKEFRILVNTLTTAQAIVHAIAQKKINHQNKKSL